MSLPAPSRSHLRVLPPHLDEFTPQAVRRTPLQLVEATLRESFGVVVPKEAIEGHLINVKNRGESARASLLEVTLGSTVYPMFLARQ